MTFRVAVCVLAGVTSVALASVDGCEVRPDAGRGAARERVPQDRPAALAGEPAAGVTAIALHARLLGDRAQHPWLATAGPVGGAAVRRRAS